MDLFKKAKQRIFRGYFRLGAHIHVRHWRGHGIHSPFMYGIVRNVFMKSKITGPDTRLYDELRRERIGRKHAVKIQNLYAHCRMESHTLVPGTRLSDPRRAQSLHTDARRIGRDDRRKSTGKRRKGRLPDPAGTSPQRTQMAHGAADPARTTLA